MEPPPGSRLADIRRSFKVEDIVGLDEAGLAFEMVHPSLASGGLFRTPSSGELSLLISGSVTPKSAVSSCSVSGEKLHSRISKNNHLGTA